MPVPTNSHYERSISPPIHTPARPALRMPSNNTSYSPTITSGSGQQKLNVVTRVAIEGKVAKRSDGASVKMYLKICIPLNSVTPGSTIPLFAEENVKIVTSQIHPLDNNSVPYNFSSTVSPLLHQAARALNLPARSSETFASALHLSKTNGTPHSSASRASKSDFSENIPPVDKQYTGEIFVSGYSIAFVLPKTFLQSRRHGSDDDDRTSRTPAPRRRSSIGGERNQVQFMAAIDMVIPLLSRPPRSPFLLSIPTPRCLHNHIKLKLPSPTNTSTSFASLSSMDEDSSGWDTSYDPHVTRIASTRPSRSPSYNGFADDESSDYSTQGDASEVPVIQGTFPSAERIAIRWAKPTKSVTLPGEVNSRLRVGVESAKGEMTCIVRGKGVSATSPQVEGILMDVEFKGQCKGIWFPGVATLLGLDVSLEAKQSDVSWAQGHPSDWQVSGSAGYTGIDAGIPTPRESNSRTSSFDSKGAQIIQQESFRTAHSQGSSTSLLRAPLPAAQNLAEYSFEGSNSTPSASHISTMSSLTGSAAIVPPPPIRLPGSPITLNLNMNDLQPPVKNVLTFSISGTILVTPRNTAQKLDSSTGSIKSTDPDPIVLPRFTVLAADKESTSITVRNEVDGASIEVFHPTGDIHSDPQARKTVLQKSGSTRCAEDGGRIALKSFDNFMFNGTAKSTNRPRTPSNNMAARVSPLPRMALNSLPLRAKRDGPPMIPSVDATVTAFTPSDGSLPDGYAVRVALRTPAPLESEWLEFGFSASRNIEPSTSSNPHPKAVLICASIDGMPVKGELTNAPTPPSGASFEALTGKQWIYWAKIHAGSSPGAEMVIDYVVREECGKGKKRMPTYMDMDILLPTFFLAIARYEVKLDVIPRVDVTNIRSEFDYVHTSPTGHRLLLCSLKEFDEPKLTVTLQKSPERSDLSLIKRYFLFTWAVIFLGFASLYQLSQQPRPSGVDYGSLDMWPDLHTVTTTQTLYESTPGVRWPLGDHDPSTPASATSPTSTDQYPKAETPLASPTQHDYWPPSNQETAAIAVPSRTIFNARALVPFMKLSWTNEQFKAALGQVLVSLELVYNFARKLYHYPLDPP